MTKIRDIKGIVEKLPEIVDNRLNWYRRETLNTDINLEDIVEVDVGKITELFIDLMLEYERLDFVPQLSDVIAKAGILKWKNI